MIKKKLNVAHYSFGFLTNRKLPSIYKRISDYTSNIEYGFTDFEKDKVSENSNLYRIYRVPPYFKLVIDNPKVHRKIELPEIDKGLLINLSKFSSFDDYITKQFSSRKRKQIHSAIRRLETCFNISYKVYLGDIDKKNYKFLFNKAKEFMADRFNQLGKKHFQLNNLDSIEDKTYNLILEKKASIFVIYDNDKPINICFNYHFNSITANSLASYDTDYDKFSLGTIDLYKQIEWNFSNNFKIFDMEIGESEYKFRWSNNHYNLSHHIIIKKNSFSSNLIGYLLFIYLKLKLKIFRLAYANPNNKMLNRLLPSETNKNIVVIKHQDFEIKTISSSAFQTEKTEKIDIENKDFKFLRKPYYNFLHSNIIKKDSTLVYELKDIENIYFLKGKNTIQQIKIIKNN